MDEKEEKQPDTLFGQIANTNFGLESTTDDSPARELSEQIANANYELETAMDESHAKEAEGKLDILNDLADDLELDI